MAQMANICAAVFTFPPLSAAMTTPRDAAIIRKPVTRNSRLRTISVGNTNSGG
eukprot:XP_001707006.1 Hypothetical protein GL50803_24446 [Giardia lamblia ATCC 50803]